MQNFSITAYVFVKPIPTDRKKDDKKTARSFVAEIYRSGNAVGDSRKATLWHTQKSA